mmetsp:Transcript_71193/g.161126  ORF Transcript_71193/g.161126 Transcript_71193/m.161126 type:complete len:559 (+) Transcript_71193:136-1812(+)
MTKALVTALLLLAPAWAFNVRPGRALSRPRDFVKVESAPTIKLTGAPVAKAGGMAGGTAARWAKSTKQVATVGPASNTLEMLEKLFMAGVDVFRLNFSHGDHEEKAGLVKLIRELEQRHGRAIGILADLQGPKHRVGMFPNADAGTKVSLKKGQMYTFDLEDKEGDEERVSLPHPDVMAALEVGHRVLIDDGKMIVIVREKDADGKWVKAEVMNDATLSSRKGFNLPDTYVPGSALTPKDLKDLQLCLDEIDFDWVALSFVQEAADILQLRELMGDHPGKVIAKIEKPNAIDNLKEITDVCDGIMVARGDLGVEMLPEDVPMLQKEIIDVARAQGKPVIVATQMLESMIESPSPTRAEVSDVATAVFDGADAVMLSAESAAGKYPIEAVTTQQKIITNVESDSSYREQLQRRNRLLSRTFSTTDAITEAAGKVATQVRAKAIVVFTLGGTTVSRASRSRHSVPVFAATSVPATARSLSLNWGVDSILLQDTDFEQDDFDELLEKALVGLRAKGVLKDPSDLVVVTAGFPFGVPGAVNNLRVLSNAGAKSWDESLVHGH